MGGSVSESTAEPLLEYVERGSGAPIVLIPGMEGAKEFWQHQMEPLAERYRVIACSYPRKRPKLGRRVSEYALDVVRLLDHLEVGRAVVIGESMGGLISQHIAIEHPERVTALALCNTLDAPNRLQFGLDRYSLATVVHHLAFLSPRPFQKPLFRWVGRNRGFVMDPSAGNDKLADYLLKHGLEAGLASNLDRVLAGLGSPTTQALASIRVPTLVLRGTEDRLVGADAVVELVGRIPHAELVLIDGGGHCCQFTMPDATNRALLDWLRRIEYGH